MAGPVLHDGRQSTPTTIFTGTGTITGTDYDAKRRKSGTPSSLGE